MVLQSSGDGWERAFWLAFEHSSNGIALVDEQRRFVEVNDACLEILGARRDEILGASLMDVIPPSEQPRAHADWHALLHSGENSGDGPVIRPDGSEAELEVAARLITVGGRRLALFVVTSASQSSKPVKAEAARERLLTPRERAVVTLIALGRGSPQIAEELCISTATVRTHVQNAMRKLGVRTRAQLVASVLSRDDTFHLPPVEERSAP